MVTLILLLMAGEVARHGYYGFALLTVITAICCMGRLWVLVGAFWLGRRLRK